MNRSLKKESIMTLEKVPYIVRLVLPRLIHYNRLPKGGHFAAWEQPELFAA
jgi:hypothetical protein